MESISPVILMIGIATLAAGCASNTPPLWCKVDTLAAPPSPS